MDWLKEIRNLISDLDLIPNCLVTPLYEQELIQRRLDESLTPLEHEIISDQLKALSLRNHSRSNSRFVQFRNTCVQIPSLFDNMV